MLIKIRDKIKDKLVKVHHGETPHYLEVKQRYSL
jgi:hypothetical protein